MKRITIGLPGLFAAGFRPSGPAWESVVSRSRIFGVVAEHGMEELAWLGLPPDSAAIAPGPLSAAAFQIWPPERAVVFEAVILGLDERDQIVPVEVSPEESAAAFACLEQLNRRNWTFAMGEAETSVLVRENGSVDVQCPSPSELLGQSWEPLWAEGDDEDVLRSLVMDSREQFEAAEFNRRRVGEGLPRLGFAWPCGPGLVQRLPNLAVARGELVRYESSSRHLKGAARLAGYWHGSLHKSLPQKVTAAIESSEPSIVVENIVGEEQADRLLSELIELVFEPLIKKRKEGDVRLTILDSQAGGLGLNYDSRRLNGNFLPFDLKVLDDSRLRSYPVHEVIQRSLTF